MRHRIEHRITRAILASCLASLSAVGVLTAHDFWVQPSRYRVEPGTALGFRLFVGDHFRGEPFARYASLIERFVVAGPAGEKPTLGLEGAEPAGVARVDQPGLYVAGYRSRHSYAQLGAEKFESYLREEGLEWVSALRSDRGESGQPVREAFSRCAKALIQVGPVDQGAHDRQLGFRLELMAERNPYSLKPGDELPVQLLFEGKPLAGVLVVFMSEQNPYDRRSGRTDQNGRISSALSEDGLWMVKAVHMVEPPPDLDANWESLWASLTFEVAPEDAAGNLSTHAADGSLK